MSFKPPTPREITRRRAFMAGKRDRASFGYDQKMILGLAARAEMQMKPIGRYIEEFFLERLTVEEFTEMKVAVDAIMETHVHDQGDG